MVAATGANPDRTKEINEWATKADGDKSGKLDEKELSALIDQIVKQYGGEEEGNKNVDPEQLKQLLGEEMKKGLSPEEAAQKILQILDALDSDDETQPIDFNKEDHTDVNEDGEVKLDDAFAEAEAEQKDSKELGYENPDEYRDAAKDKGFTDSKGNGSPAMWKDALKRGYKNDKDGAKAYKDDKKAGKLNAIEKSDKDVAPEMKKGGGGGE